MAAPNADAAEAPNAAGVLKQTAACAKKPPAGIGHIGDRIDDEVSADTVAPCHVALDRPRQPQLTLFDAHTSTVVAQQLVNILISDTLVLTGTASIDNEAQLLGQVKHLLAPEILGKFSLHLLIALADNLKQKRLLLPCLRQIPYLSIYSACLNASASKKSGSCCKVARRSLAGRSDELSAPAAQPRLQLLAAGQKSAWC